MNKQNEVNLKLITIEVAALETVCFVIVVVGAGVVGSVVVAKDAVDEVVGTVVVAVES